MAHHVSDVLSLRCCALGPVELTDRETADDPVLGGALTLRQARELANKIDRQRALGIDVIEDRKAERSRKAATAAATLFD